MEEALLLALLFVAALASCTIASTKRRSPAAWIVLGALLPVVSLITITCLPALPDENVDLERRSVDRGRQPARRKCA